MSVLPLMMHMKDVSSVVIGGGTVAARRVLQIIDAGGSVCVVAPSLHESLSSLEEEGLLSWHPRKASASEVFLTDLVFLCTDDAYLHDALQERRAPRQLIYRSDRAFIGNFHIPAKIQRGRLTVAITSNGASPIYTKSIQQKVKEALPDSAADDLEFLAKARQHILTDPDLRPMRAELLEQLTDPKLLASKDRQAQYEKLIKKARER